MKNIPLLRGNLIQCPIFIATSNLFLPMLRPFVHLFNKFWSSEQPVIFLGYSKPNFDLPKNFSFVSMGEQRGINYWSDDVKPIIEILLLLIQSISDHKNLIFFVGTLLRLNIS